MFDFQIGDIIIITSKLTRRVVHKDLVLDISEEDYIKHRDLLNKKTLSVRAGWYNSIIRNGSISTTKIFRKGKVIHL